MTSPDQAADSAELDVEDRFAIVPEWLLDAEISDCAVRLYAVLLRFGQCSGARMPSRSTLAKRMHKKSTDTIDRAMRELVDLGAVAVKNRFDGGQRLTNKYLVRTSRPSRSRPGGGGTGGGRKNAATPTPAATGTSSVRGSRTDAARVAADLRHNPESFTESSSPPPSIPPAATTSSTPPVSWEAEAARLIDECGIGDWDGFVADVVRLRRDANRATTRWSGHCLLAALKLAVGTRGWPAARAAAALRVVAADAATHSPMRLAEAGPWWDEPAPSAARSAGDNAELVAMEGELADVDGLRVVLQMQAREQLTAEGEPVTRATVIRRAHRLLLAQRAGTEAAAC